MKFQAVPLVRELFSFSWSRRNGFDPMPVDLRFVLEKVVLRHVLIWDHRHPLSMSSHQFSILFHLSVLLLITRLYNLEETSVEVQKVKFRNTCVAAIFRETNRLYTSKIVNNIQKITSLYLCPNQRLVFHTWLLSTKS